MYLFWVALTFVVCMWVLQTSRWHEQLRSPQHADPFIASMTMRSTLRSTRSLSPTKRAHTPRRGTAEAEVDRRNDTSGTLM